jgi:hypothetical protein
LFLFLYLNRREILRFAQNDRTRPFFRSLFNRFDPASASGNNLQVKFPQWPSLKRPTQPKFSER